MRQVLSQQRTVFIHDYDGVHYDYADHPDIIDFLGDVKAHVVSVLMPFLGAAHAKEMGKQSYLQTGDGLRYYMEEGERRGMDVLKLRREMHIEYHRVGREWILEQQPQIFAPCVQTNNHFEALKGFVQHGILTQSCVDSWAKPLLAIQERLDYFERDAVIGFAECDFMAKAMSTRPLQIALHALHAKPEEAVFLEDTLNNLRKAKELDERLMTVYFCHGKPLRELPDYVDMQTRNMRTFMQHARSIFNPVMPQPLQDIAFHI